MSYTYANLESRVRNNIDSQTASVSDIIDDAINFMSNFFFLKKIDTSKSTVANQSYIAKPTNCLKVIGEIKIGEDYFKRRESAQGLAEIDDYELERYEEADDAKIYIYPTPTSVQTCKMEIHAGFTPLGGVAAAVTDIKDSLVPLLVILATWLYWEKIATNVATGREDYPDMTPKEARSNADAWKKQFDSLYETISKTN
jgi:hypothetical protein